MTKYSRKRKNIKSYKTNNRKDKTKTKKRSLRRRAQKGGSQYFGYGRDSFNTQVGLTGTAQAPRVSKVSKVLTVTNNTGKPVIPGGQINYIGEAITEYLTQSDYTTTEKVYSDHAPIKYVINNKTIITWNIGQWGCLGPYIKSDRVSEDSKIVPIQSINKFKKFDDYTYNHKFNNLQLETQEQYKKRLENIANALNEMNEEYPNAIFLLQELPVIVNSTNIEKGPFPVNYLSTLLPIFYQNTKMLLSTDDLSSKKYETYETYGTIMSECVSVFNDALSIYGLKILKQQCSSSMIVKNTDITFIDYNLVEKSILYHVMGIDVHKPFPVTSIDSGINGFLDKSDPTNLYISIHVRYKSYLNLETNTYNDTTKLKDILEQYKIQIKQNNLLVSDKNKIKKVYFCGDFNMPASLIKKTNYPIYTTNNGESFSLADNKGNKNPENIDLILEMDIT